MTFQGKLDHPYTLLQRHKDAVVSYNVNFLRLDPPSQAELQTVELRNNTHIVMICGPELPAASTKQQKFQDERGDFEVIPGYPKHVCSVRHVNLFAELLAGESLVVIPRLAQPEIASTKVEVSGVLLQGFGSSPRDVDVSDNR